MLNINTKFPGFESTFKIFLTNWINLVMTIIATIEILLIYYAAIAQFPFLDAVVWSAYITVLYGMRHWIVFIGGLFILDVILFEFNKKLGSIAMKLAIEWLLIGLPFMYKAYMSNDWVLFCALLAFAVGQYVRQDYIKKLLES